MSYQNLLLISVIVAELTFRIFQMYPYHGRLGLRRHAKEVTAELLQRGEEAEFTLEIVGYLRKQRFIRFEKSAYLSAMAAGRALIASMMLCSQPQSVVKKAPIFSAMAAGMPLTVSQMLESVPGSSLIFSKICGIYGR